MKVSQKHAVLIKTIC